MLTVNFANEELVTTLSYIGSSIVLMSVTNKETQQHKTEPFYFETPTQAYNFIFDFGNDLIENFGLDVVL